MTYSLGKMCQMSGVNHEGFKKMIEEMIEINPERRISVEEALEKLKQLELKEENEEQNILFSDFMKDLKAKTERNSAHFGLKSNLIQIKSFFIEIQGGELDPSVIQ